MTQTHTVIDRYLAAWNETDPGARRRRIEALWAPGGASLNRTLEARGADALFARVTGANDKWVRDGGFEFRPASIQAHSEVIRCAWEMGPRGTGEVESRAQSFLVLDDEGRILCDYQFPMQAPEDAPDVTALARAYVAFWNETDAAARAEMAGRLWSPRGEHADAHGRQRGLDAILAEAGLAAAAYAARDRPFVQDGPADGHNGAVRLDWTAGSGEARESGQSLLLLDGAGRIDRAYTFEDARVAVPAE